MNHGPIRGSLPSLPTGRLVERKALTPKGRTGVKTWQTWAWKVWKEDIKREERDWKKLVCDDKETQASGNHCGLTIWETDN